MHLTLQADETLGDDELRSRQISIFFQEPNLGISRYSCGFSTETVVSHKEQLNAQCCSFVIDAQVVLFSSF